MYPPFPSTVSHSHPQSFSGFDRKFTKSRSGSFLLDSAWLSDRPGSLWRESIQATWTHLRKSYRISSPWPSGITVNPGRAWELSELKRMAQVMIHFEEPLHRAGINDDEICRRLWRGNPVLGTQLPSEAIAAVGAASSIDDLVALIQPEYTLDVTYHFSLYGVESDTSNLDFVYPALASPAQAIDRIEFTLSLVRACMLGRPLSRYAPNAEGLREFMTGKRLPEGALRFLHRNRG